MNYNKKILAKINSRIREKGIKLKNTYANCNTEQQFKRKVLEQEPSLLNEFPINYINFHLNSVYHGFEVERIITQSVKSNYQIGLEGWIDLKYQIDILVNNKVAIQIKSIYYLNNSITEIAEYIFDCINMKNELENTTDIKINNLLFVFYDSHDDDRLYYITYDKLVKILIGYHKTYSDTISLKDIKQRFTEIGFVDDFYLDDYLKEIIDKYLD